MGQYFESAKIRVKNIDWNYKSLYRPSHAILISEFIKRERAFETFHSVSYAYRFWALRVIKGKLSKNIMDEIEGNIRGYIEKMLSDWNIEGYARLNCFFYIEWAYLVDQGIPEAVQFQDLYDPIIKLYERGGRVHYRNPMDGILCESYAWNHDFRLLRDIYPQDLQELRDEVLDEFDDVWYYHKIIYEIKKHMINAEEVATNMIERLQKYDELTKSMVFTVELAELLLENKINSDRIGSIKYDLKSFDINQLENKLSKSEKIDLSSRITDVLNRLDI